MRSDRAPLALKLGAFAGLLFLHLPVVVIFVYAFTTEDRSYQWPPPGLTLDWIYYGKLEGLTVSMARALENEGSSPDTESTTGSKAS